MHSVLTGAEHMSANTNRLEDLHSIVPIITRQIRYFNTVDLSYFDDKVYIWVYSLPSKLRDTPCTVTASNRMSSSHETTLPDEE